jgi:hypothetical protein
MTDCCPMFTSGASQPFSLLILEFHRLIKKAGMATAPLKDRIQSQILTHYPTSLSDGIAITRQEAATAAARVRVPELLEELIERVAVAARDSEYIDAKSGVSARMTITAFEHLVASAELRALAAGAVPEVRMTDLLAILPAVTGKVELVYEGEQEGPESVAHHLIGKAIRAKFPEVFPDPELIRRRKLEDVYAPVVAHVAAHGVEVIGDEGVVLDDLHIHNALGFEENEGDLAASVCCGGVHAGAFEHHACMPRLRPADEGKTSEESDTNEQERHVRTLTANRAAGKSCVRCSCRRRGGMFG